MQVRPKLLKRFVRIVAAPGRILETVVDLLRRGSKVAPLQLADCVQHSLQPMNLVRRVG